MHKLTSIATLLAVSLLVVPSVNCTPKTVAQEDAAINCLKAEGDAITAGKDVLQLAVQLGTELALAAAAGGLDGAITAVEAMIVQYGEPVVACAVQKIPTAGSGSATASMAQIDPVSQLRLELVEHFGWRFAQ